MQEELGKADPWRNESGILPWWNCQFGLAMGAGDTFASGFARQAVSLVITMGMN